MISRPVAAACVALILGGSTLRAEDGGSVSWLFLQNATRASFDGTTLTLIGINPETLAFSERPYRVARRISTAGFLMLWTAGADAFAADPPNAGVSALEDGEFRNAIIELTNPRTEGDILRYDVVVLSGTLSPEAIDVSVMIDSFPTVVNDQITDSVTQVNTKVLGDAPASSMGNLFVATSQALSNAADNATLAQQAGMTEQAATTAGVSTLYALDTASTGAATADILK